MKTTLDIPEKLLSEAERLLKARTESEAVVLALCEAVRARQTKHLLSRRGKGDVEDVSEELEEAELEDIGRSR